MHWGMFSTSGDIVMHVRGYHEYIRACSVHQGNIMMHVGDTMSTSGEYHDACGGYHKYIGVFNIN